MADLSPADRLTRAAAHIREVAEGAKLAVGDGPWTAHTCWRNDGTLQWEVLAGDAGFLRTPTRLVFAASPSKEQAVHACLWSPPVTLAIAAWLDEVVQRGHDHPKAYRGMKPALAVADAVLGTEETS